VCLPIVLDNSSIIKGVEEETRDAEDDEDDASSE